MTDGTLILVPTEQEREALFGSCGRPDVRVCGFGLAEAGARAAHALATSDGHISTAVLVGVAGTYDPGRWPVGSAVVGGSVRCHGIGAGGQTSRELGFAGSDVMPLAGSGPEILSVAMASGDPGEAAARHARHPQAAVEEMEGFAVAVAAAAFGVPLRIVRGVSNVAGQRDRAAWRFHEALEAAAAALDTVTA